MEENNSAGHARRMESAQDGSDAVLARLFGSTLQAATLRFVVYLAIISAIAATIARLW